MWGDTVRKLKVYKPKLHTHLVVWKPPDTGKLKYNTDGASKGNPGPRSYAFCLRDSQGNLVYARTAGMGEITNTEAKLWTIYKAVEFCWERKLREVIF
uniref:Putative ovule protein n=1 Tax=Solanum chacoense TaxID=4108 RepID=A0A0V0IH31_SOLCH